MTYVDQTGSYTIPLRCPVPRAGSGHSYQLFDDGGACQRCGAEPGTAADTWPCGTHVPSVGVDVDSEGPVSACLVNVVAEELITDVLNQVSRVHGAESNDDEHEATMDLLSSVSNLVSHLPTT